MSDLGDVHRHNLKLRRKIAKNMKSYLEENNIIIGEEYQNNVFLIEREEGLKNIVMSFHSTHKHPEGTASYLKLLYNCRYEGEGKWFKKRGTTLVNFIKNIKPKPSVSNKPIIPKHEYNMSLLEPLLKEYGYIENDNYQINEDKTVLRVLLDKENGKFIDVLLNKKKKDFLNCSYGKDTIYTYSIEKFKSLL